MLSRYMQEPTKQHLGAAERVLCYVVGTIDFGTWYFKDANFNLINSDWLGSKDNRKSTTGNVFNWGSWAISWSSKKQDVVALSSSKAEYVVVTSEAGQALCLRRMLVDVSISKRVEQKYSAITRQQLQWQRNRFFVTEQSTYIHYHFICDHTTRGDIELKYCSTRDQIADVLSKSLSQAKYDQKLGVCNFESRRV